MIARHERLPTDISPDFSSVQVYCQALYDYQSSRTRGEHLQGKALQDFVIDKIDDLKGQDIVAIDVHGKSSITDCMIICTGTSTRHVMSIADHVVQESRAAGMLPLGVEGKPPPTGSSSTSAT